MRLSETSLRRVRELVRRHMPSQVRWELRLFGSRLDDELRGGDVDLYLELEGMNAEERMQLKRRLRPALEELLDCPVDLVIQDRNAPLKAISGIARSQGLLI